MLNIKSILMQKNSVQNFFLLGIFHELAKDPLHKHAKRSQKSFLPSFNSLATCHAKIKVVCISLR